MNARVDFDYPDDGAVAQLRIPPHSIEAESSVLGALLLDNSAWDRVSDLLTDADFYRFEHRLTFAAIASLVNASKPADVVTVHERLQGMKDGREVTLAYLGQLAQYVPSAGNIRRYAEIVRERSILRKLVAVSDEIATKAFNPAGADAAAVLDEAQRLVLGVAEQGASASDDWQDLQDGMVALLDRIQEQSDGTATPDFIPTGLTLIDQRLDGGMRGGELIVLAARPSMGKSALAMTIAKHVAVNEGLPVAVFSMEMPKAQLNARLMSMQSYIHLSRIKRAERLRDFDWPELTKAVEILSQAPISISDKPSLNINQVRTRARALHRRRGRLGCIVVDYLGLMAGTDPKMSRAYQLEEITTGLKSLAKELNTTVLLLAQVSRKVEERIDQMPMLSDLRDSGAIEQDADIVIFVHREYKAKPGLGDEWKYHAKVAVAKSRDGDPGLLDLQYIGENTRFMDWPEDRELPTSMARTKPTGKQL